MNLRSSSINPKEDFKFLIKWVVDGWFIFDFGTMVDDLAVQPDIVEVVGYLTSASSFHWLVSFMLIPARIFVVFRIVYALLR